MMTSFALISILHVFGRVHDISERVEGNIHASRKVFKAATLGLKQTFTKKLTG